MQVRFHRHIAAFLLAADCNVPQRPPAVIRSFTFIQMVHTHVYIYIYHYICYITRICMCIYIYRYLYIIYIYLYIYIPTCYSWLLLIHPVENGGSCDWKNGHPNSGAKRGNGKSSIGKSMKIH